MNWTKIVDILVGNFGKSDSAVGTFNKKDFLKTMRTASLAALGAAAVAFAGSWTGYLETVDWGLLETLMTAGIAACLEALQRWRKDNTKE